MRRVTTLLRPRGFVLRIVQVIADRSNGRARRVSGKSQPEPVRAGRWPVVSIGQGSSRVDYYEEDL